MAGTPGYVQTLRVVTSVPSVTLPLAHTYALLYPRGV